LATDVRAIPQMSHPIDIYTTPEGDFAVARVLVDIDFRTSPALRAALLDLLGRQRRKCLVLDLEGVRRIDSSGVASLVEGWREARRRHARLILTGMNDSIRRILALTRLSGLFEVRPTVKEALALAA
jgi:anti-anti-sigma factor